MGYTSYFVRPQAQLKCRKKCNASLAGSTNMGITVIPLQLPQVNLLQGFTNWETRQGLNQLWFANPKASSQLWVAATQDFIFTQLNLSK